MNEELEQLKRRIEVLEKKLVEKERRQITFPLDVESQKILGNYFPRFISDRKYVGGASGREFTDYYLQVGNRRMLVGSALAELRYEVNASTNVFTLSEGEGIDDNTEIYFLTENTAPAPIVAGATYYVINSSGLTFKISATLGGAEVNITDTGTGAQYVGFL